MDRIISYFQTNWQEYLRLLGQHLEVTLIVVVVAIVIAVPLGILCSKHRRFQAGCERFFGFLRVVPSLAVLIACIPIIGTGILPAVVALTILAIPPILLNTAQAFINLPEQTIEAAVGMGMSSRYCFFKVKLPLAFPVIFTGIRTAVVEVIASATLAAYIGAGGLGSIIFTGLGLMRTDLLLIGGGSVAFLSLFTGWLLDSYYKRKTRYLG